MASLAALCVEHAAFEGVNLDRAPDERTLGAALFGDAPPLLCWVAEGDGGIVGYATATREFSTWHAGFYLHMDCLYLKPGARGCGLGEQLVRMLATDAIRLQCSGMQWQTPAANLRAATFYRRIGAQSKDKLRFYLSDRELFSLASSGEASELHSAYHVAFVEDAPCLPHESDSGTECAGQGSLG